MRLRERDLKVKADHAQHYTQGPTHKSTYSPAQEFSGSDDSSFIGVYILAASRARVGHQSWPKLQSGNDV
jgi:hypothetical protein